MRDLKHKSADARNNSSPIARSCIGKRSTMKLEKKSSKRKKHLVKLCNPRGTTSQTSTIRGTRDSRMYFTGVRLLPSIDTIILTNVLTPRQILELNPESDLSKFDNTASRGKSFQARLDWSLNEEPENIKKKRHSALKSIKDNIFCKWHITPNSRSRLRILTDPGHIARGKDTKLVNDLKNSFIFPRKEREKRKKNNIENFQTIDETEIKNINVEEIIGRALDDAHKDAEHLGIRVGKNVVNISNIKSFQIEEETEIENEINIKDIELNHTDRNNVDMIFEHDTIKNFLERDNTLETSAKKNNIEEDVDLNDFSPKNVNLGVDSPYLKVQAAKKVHNY
ncbi:hypothetical protein FQR65_LT06610 [Abscondita terminalis]|nr:hypothetical protein FQR65_LT06610 [Abscondita terminalis]